jgi:hypothetical protein
MGGAIVEAQHIPEWIYSLPADELPSFSRAADGQLPYFPFRGVWAVVLPSQSHMVLVLDPNTRFSVGSIMAEVKQATAAHGFTQYEIIVRVSFVPK